MDVSPLIRQWASRARWQQSLRLAGLGLAAGLGVALLIGLAARLQPILTRPALIVIAVALTLFGLLLALVWPWLRTLKKGELGWAREFDARFGLSERLSTTLEVSDGKIKLPNQELRRKQQADSTQVASDVDTKINQWLPLRLNWRDIAVAGAFAIALALVIALPNPQEQALADRARMQETMKREAQRLEQAKEAIKASTLSEQEKKAALEAIEQAQRALNDGNSTPEKSMAAINDAQSKLDALKDQAAQQASEDLRQAGQSLTADELTNTLADSLQRGEFEQAANQMRQLAQTGDKPPSADESERIARQLEQIARRVQNSDPTMAENLRNAAQEVREGRTEEARQSLERAAQSLEKTNARTQQNNGLTQAQQRAEEARRAISQASQDQNARNAQGQQNSQQQGQQPGEQPGQNGEQQGQSGQPGESGQQAGQQGQQGQQGQAGQNSQSGQPGQGGQQAGQQGGSGQVGANQSGGGTSSQSQGGGQGGRSGHSEDSGSDNSVYAPGRVNSQGQQVVLPEAQGENAPDPNGRRNTAPGGNTSVAYEDVYQDYAQTADEAIESGQVPAERRDYVRDYFSSLDPEQQNTQNSP